MLIFEDFYVVTALPYIWVIYRIYNIQYLQELQFLKFTAKAKNKINNERTFPFTTILHSTEERKIMILLTVRGHSVQL